MTRLPTRLALIGVATLVLTLLVVGLITYQIVRVTGRQDIDRLLRQELNDLAAGFPRLLAEQDEPSSSDLGRVAQQYLAVHPGSDRHLTVITIGANTYSTRTGPEELRELQDERELPTGEFGALATVGTQQGPVRVLSAPLAAGGTTIGRVTIAGPLADVRREATGSLARIGVAGLVGLVLGGGALVVSTRRALLPVTQLAITARSTGGADLAARVPEPARMDEVGVLAHEFNRMLDRIAVETEQRRRLVAAVSHELRTPLAVARGHLEMFQALDPDDHHTATRVAQIVQDELDRLGRIVDDLTAIAHGGPGADIEIGAVWVPDVIEELRERIAGLGVTGVVLGDPPPAVVEADQQRLAQSLLNLVVNATTHTPPGTAAQVNITEDEAYVSFSVSDEGPGVDPAVRDRLFEPFVTTRADGSGAGSGLGLAVVRTLTEGQGGTVAFETGPQGTTITLRFPVAR